jgi:hypothetical protein
MMKNVLPRTFSSRKANNVIFCFALPFKTLKLCLKNGDTFLRFAIPRRLGTKANLPWFARSMLSIEPLLRLNSLVRHHGEPARPKGLIFILYTHRLLKVFFQ